MNVELNGLSLESVFKYIKPEIACHMTTMKTPQLHRQGILVDGSIYDFIEYIVGTFHAMEKDFANFQKRKPKHFFKKVWLYCYSTKCLPYSKNRYEQLLKQHSLPDNALTRITFDVFREVLAIDDKVPHESMTFLNYKNIVEKEGELFAMDTLYQHAGIDRDWKPLEEHIQKRLSRNKFAA